MVQTGGDSLLHVWDSNIHGDTASRFEGGGESRLCPPVMKMLGGVLACGSLGCDNFVKYGVKPQNIFYFPYEPDYQLIEIAPGRGHRISSDRLE